jgi:hypothetical protein
MKSKLRVVEITREERDLDEMQTRRVQAYLGLKNIHSVRQIKALVRVQGRKGVYRTTSVIEYRTNRRRRRRAAA